MTSSEEKFNTSIKDIIGRIQHMNTRMAVNHKFLTEYSRLKAVGNKKEEMSTLTQCGVCMERYDTERRMPRLMKCFHTVCQTCISLMLREGNSYYHIFNLNHWDYDQD